MIRYITLFASCLFLTGCFEPDARHVLTPSEVDSTGMQNVKTVLLDRFTNSSGGGSSMTPESTLRTAIKLQLENAGFKVSNAQAVPEAERGNFDLVISADITAYKFIPKDKNGMVPGWCIPGCIPFGPIGGGAVYLYDDATKTSEFEITVQVTQQATGNGKRASTSVHYENIEGERSESEHVSVAANEIAKKIVASVSR